jgi:hypothetical protein
MDHKAFVGLVARMRQAQKTFFTTRETAALREATDLERQVDKAIQQARNTTPLFAGQQDGGEA